MGPAPKWAAYLDNVTEELKEEETTAVYDDYKFVTRAELDAMGVLLLWLWLLLWLLVWLLV